MSPSEAATSRRRAHGRLSAACVALAVVALAPAVVLGYLQRAVVDPEQFADRAAAALAEPPVRALAAEQITDRLVLANAGDLVTARPLIESIAAEVVGGGAFRSLFRAAVLDLHRAAIAGDEGTVTLTIADAGTVIAAAVRALDPSLAEQLDDDAVELVRRELDARAAAPARLAERIDALAGILLAVAVLAAAAGILFAPDRRVAVGRLGAGAAAVGVLIVVGELVARAVVLGRVGGGDERAAAGAVWDAYLFDLRTTGALLAAAGAVIAAAAAAVLPAIDLEPALARLRRLVVVEPAQAWLRALRGLMLIAAGALVIASPGAALALVATLAGVALIYVGAEALLRLTQPSGPGREVAGRARRLVSPGIVGALVACAALGFLVVSGDADEPALAVTGCNGASELCDRPLDEVAFATTHNAMSAPLPGYFSSQQDAPIGDQLADGVRGLQIDTHYGDLLPNGNVRTELTGDLRAQVGADGVSDEAVAAALRIRDRLGFRGEGERGMYLCHAFCELGFVPLDDVLDTIHEFLVANPGEVVVVINEDYVTPADFVAAVERAGLGDLVATPPAGRAWPTLGELIRQDRRLIVMAENEAGAAPWYQLAYARLTEETPFSFGRAAELTDPATLDRTCVANRGPEGAPLFLINHWITTDPVPRPSNAARVNAFEPLMRRARRCAELRDHVVNLLAVDFYRRGDLFAVVDALNGVR